MSLSCARWALHELLLSSNPMVPWQTNILFVFARATLPLVSNWYFRITYFPLVHSYPCLTASCSERWPISSSFVLNSSTHNDVRTVVVGDVEWGRHQLGRFIVFLQMFDAAATPSIGSIILVDVACVITCWYNRWGSLIGYDKADSCNISQLLKSQ